MTSKKITTRIEESHKGDYFKLIAQYLEEYGPNTVVLYQTGHFLEMYVYYDPKTGVFSGSNCVEIAKLLDLKVGPSNCVYIDPYTSQQKDIYMSGFTLEYSAEKHIQRLQTLNYTVVVYLEEPKAAATASTTASSKKTPIKRYLHAIISPGTHIMSDESADSTLTNNIACAWIDKKIPAKGTAAFRLACNQPTTFIAIAMVNIFTGETTIFQYSDRSKDLRAYDELDNFLFINRPNEIIFIHNNIELDPVLQYLELKTRPNLLIRSVDLNSSMSAAINTTRALNATKQVYQNEIIRKFYGADKVAAVFADIAAYDLATQAFVYLLEDIHKHNPNLVKRLHTPKFENHTAALMLPNHSLKQLNILNDGITSQDATSARLASVSDFLNQCITPMGKRQFKYNLVHPMYPTTDTHIARLQAEYDIIAELLTSVVGHDPEHVWRAALAPIKDLSKYERQILNHKTAPATFYHIFNTLNNARGLVNIISPAVASYFENSHNIRLSDVSTAIDRLNAVIGINILVEEAGNITQPRNTYNELFMAPTASPAIKLITENYNNTNRRLLALKTYLDAQVPGCDDAVTINETDKEGIITLVATSRRCTLIAAALPKTTVMLEGADIPLSKTHIQITKTTAKDTAANKSRIHSPEIDALCEAARLYKKDMCDQVTRAYGQFICEFERDYLDALALISQFITTCDMIYTKAALAYKYGYCKPVIRDGETAHIRACGLRHPLIEQILTTHVYVPNDVTLGADQPTQGHLLYGTNMVGKTSFIKSVGIAVIMAQAGLYVPAAEFEYAPYQYLFTRILGTDNLFKGQSTFATEMLELRTILTLANARSLVLGDELCAGTETASAVGIFMSGVRHLYQAGASFIFATHLHELMDFPEYMALMPHLRACHMRVHYDRATDSLVYDRDICEGAGDTMYGLEVCTYLKMPDAFLQQAYQYRADFIAAREPDILSLKPSRYNSAKLKGGVCEACGAALSTEIHHTIEQHTANAAGLVTTARGAKIHKNHVANLVALCESCHHAAHKKN